MQHDIMCKVRTLFMVLISTKESPRHWPLRPIIGTCTHYTLQYTVESSSHLMRGSMWKLQKNVPIASEGIKVPKKQRDKVYTSSISHSDYQQYISWGQ